jgi:class 3 adenylate cyclase/TolB-like protein
LTGERVKRRLAAVLAADVAGYSRLMGRDEERTLAELKSFRKTLVDPGIAAHRGRIVKTTGDGMLVEFASAVDAVRCAVEIQRGIVRKNADVSQDVRIEFRIGIHVGDIIIDDNDIFGDGVNIAARLEGIAEPGGVCISDDAHRQIRGKVDIAFDDMGPQNLKNIAEPMRAWRTQIGGDGCSTSLKSNQTLAIPTKLSKSLIFSIGVAAVVVLIAVGGATWYLRGGTIANIQQVRPTAYLSIVVLPFTNLSGDPEQEYFADGLTGDLTTFLARIPGNFVIAGNTAFTYKGKAVDAKQIGRDLGVRQILEGSVRRTGDQVRINAQLIDAETGAHIWADQFDRSRADLATWQNDLVLRIARALNLEMINAETRRGDKKSANQLDAEDLALRASALLRNNPSPSQISQVRRLGEQALQLDKNSLRGLLALAASYYIEAFLRFTDAPAESAARADELVMRALDLAPDNADAHFAKGHVLTLQGHLDRAILEFETAITIDPSAVGASARIGLLKLELGQAEELFAPVQRAIQISPRDPMLANWYFFLGMANFHLGRDVAATQMMLKSVGQNAKFGFSHQWLAAIYALQGRDAEASAELAEFNRLIPGRTIKNLQASERSDNPTFWSQRQRFYEGLRTAGLPE